METILQILEWIVPAGGVGTAAGWFWNRKVSQAKSKKEVHDTFRQMYEDVSVALLSLQKKYDELSERFNESKDNEARFIRAANRLSRAIEAIPLCAYHSQCPVLVELQDVKNGGDGVVPPVGASRQRKAGVVRSRDDRDRKTVHRRGQRAPVGTARDGDEPSSGCVLHGKVGPDPCDVAS